MPPLRRDRAVSGAAQRLSPATAETPFECPTSRHAEPRVAVVGSSTAVHVHRVMKRTASAWGIQLLDRSRAATGLARVDFFDWEPELHRLRERDDPDVWIMVIGGNDSQALRTARGRGGRDRRRWVERKDPRWPRLYAARVRALLRAMDPDRDRTIVWIGPHRLEWRSSQRIAPLVTALVDEELARWGGNALFVNAYEHTTTPDGEIRRHVRVAGTRYLAKTRGKDRLHMTLDGLRWQVLEPLYQELGPCFTAAAPGPLPRRPVALEPGPERRDPLGLDSQTARRETEQGVDLGAQLGASVPDRP